MFLTSLNKGYLKQIERERIWSQILPRTKKRIIECDIVPSSVATEAKVEIITDLDIELSTSHPIIIPLSHSGKVDICDSLQLKICNENVNRVLSQVGH